MENKAPFIEIDAKHFAIAPYYPNALPGYEIPKNDKTGKELPDCCGFHQSIFSACQTQIKSPEKITISKKVVLQVTYTEHCIEERIETETWYKDITDYIEYNVHSFGHPAIGANLYIESVKHWILKSTPTKFKLTQEKRKSLLEFIQSTYFTKPKEKSPSLNLLYSTYHKWLHIFPFNNSYFKGFKTHFKDQLPILSEKPIVNQYTGIAKAKVVSNVKLIEILVQITKNLLQLVDNEKRLQSNTNSHQLDIINENHKIRQDSLLLDFDINEKHYIRLLKQWLSNEKEYFKDIAPLFENNKQESKPAEKREDKMTALLSVHGFFDLPMVKALSKENQAKLISKITFGKLPYTIALIDFLGFVKHLEDKNKASKYKVNKILADLLNEGKNDRAIKANIAVLSEKSGEDKKRYTAHKHKEAVITYYQQLK